MSFTIYVAEDGMSETKIRATKAEIIDAAREMWINVDDNRHCVDVFRVQTVALTKAALIEILVSHGGSYEASSDCIGTVQARNRSTQEPKFYPA